LLVSLGLELEGEELELEGVDLRALGARPLLEAALPR